ncbi:MAG TPA: GxxExxY protein [Longimicrobiales bacterium]|nr:GxxExxY protein [Longimicrobiales bacterium]
MAPAVKLTGRIIQCIIHVHQTLGPGFLESVYRRALVIELRKQKLTTEAEKEIGRSRKGNRVYYDGQEVGKHRLDLLVEGQVIVELKTAEALGKAHYAQVRSPSGHAHGCGTTGKLRRRPRRLPSGPRLELCKNARAPMRRFVFDKLRMEIRG